MFIHSFIHSFICSPNPLNTILKIFELKKNSNGQFVYEHKISSPIYFVEMQFLMYSPFLFYCDSHNIPTSQFDTFVTWNGFESGKSAFTFLSNCSLICSLFHRTTPKQLLLPSASPHPSPDIFPKFCQSGAWGPEKEKQDGALWWLTFMLSYKWKARILQESGLVFQFSDLLSYW